MKKEINNRWSESKILDGLKNSENDSNTKLFESNPSQKIEEENEICVCCGEQTNVPINENIENRDFYIEGVGQLCITCYKKIYI